jgi:hypothetical protein
MTDNCNRRFVARVTLNEMRSERIGFRGELLVGQRPIVTDVRNFIRILRCASSDRFDDVHRLEALINKRRRRKPASAVQDQQCDDDRKIVQHKQREPQPWILRQI